MIHSLLTGVERAPLALLLVRPEALFCMQETLKTATYWHFCMLFSLTHRQSLYENPHAGPGVYLLYLAYAEPLASVFQGVEDAEAPALLRQYLSKTHFSALLRAGANYFLSAEACTLRKL